MQTYYEPKATVVSPLNVKDIAVFRIPESVVLIKGDVVVHDEDNAWEIIEPVYPGMSVVKGHKTMSCMTKEYQLDDEAKRFVRNRFLLGNFIS